MEIRTFFARLDALFHHVVDVVGVRGVEIAVRASDHDGRGARGGAADEGLAASVHGELKRTV